MRPGWVCQEPRFGGLARDFGDCTLATRKDGLAAAHCQDGPARRAAAPWPSARLSTPTATGAPRLPFRACAGRGASRQRGAGSRPRGSSESSQSGGVRGRFRQADPAEWVARALCRCAGPWEWRRSMRRAKRPPEGDRRFWRAPPALGPASSILGVGIRQLAARSQGLAGRTAVNRKPSLTRQSFQCFLFSLTLYPYSGGKEPQISQQGEHIDGPSHPYVLGASRKRNWKVSDRRNNGFTHRRDVQPFGRYPVADTVQLVTVSFIARAFGNLLRGLDTLADEVRKLQVQDDRNVRKDELNLAVSCDDTAAQVD